MKIHILSNALDPGDAVSTHCVLLKQRAIELGLEAGLYAEFCHPALQDCLTPWEELWNASPKDVLLHQLFNATGLLSYVDSFPGTRVLMYHNVTPPRFFPPGTPVHDSCVGGLAAMRSASGLYHYAVGMSEFSRLDLAEAGYPHTGVYPLALDLEALTALRPDPVVSGLPLPAGLEILFVGRIARNKCIHDLLRLVSAYRDRIGPAHLVLVGDDAQHPDYKSDLLRLAGELSLAPGSDVCFTGKVPAPQLAAYYRRANVFVSMSEHEGFCAPLMESMAFRLPTFAFAAGACAEVMGNAGVVFGSKDFGALAESIRSVVQDESRKRVLLQVQDQRVEQFGSPAQRAHLRELLETASRFAPSEEPRQPRVSVVINTYNRAAMLPLCLDSLAKQRYRVFEVVIVNGPSTDGTKELLAKYQGQLRAVETSSRVLSVSRNEGIVHAAGELVAFIDDDAVADPGWLEQLVPPFRDPEVGAAGGMVYRAHGLGVEFRNGILDREGFVRWDQPHPGRHWNWEGECLNTVSGNNCIFRRSALEKIGGFDERIEYYHDEADVVLRLRLAGFRTVHRPAAIVFHAAARGLNRSGRFHVNWYAVCKNTLYCAIKNYSGPGGRLRLAGRVAARVLKRHAGDILGWWLRRNIGLGDCIGMQWQTFRGVAVGLRRGLFCSSAVRKIGPAESAGEFLPYPGRPVKALTVCLLTQSLPQESPGGIATYTWQLARSLDRLGCGVHVVTRGRQPSENRDGVWVHFAEITAGPDFVDSVQHPTAAKNLSYAAAVRAKVLDIEARWGIDVLESPNWDVEGLLCAMEKRLPVVVRTHSPLFRVMETQGWPETPDLSLCCELENWLLRDAEIVTGSTRAILALVGKRHPLNGKQALLPLGIEDPVSAPRPPGGMTVLFVGRLEPRKGIHTLLEAIPRVLQRCPEAHFEIAGRDDDDGADGPVWQQRWERQAGPWLDRVKFRGEVGAEELARLYAQCDLFVAPSLYESFGLVYLEAMAHGKAVVGCRTGGVPEVVVEGETGLLVAPGDAGALAEAILQLLSNEACRLQMGAAGRRRFESEYSASRMAQRSQEVYERACRHWEQRSGTVWEVRPLDMTCDPACRCVLLAETGKSYLLSEPGRARTAVYGPYMTLGPGTYRAQFKIWLGGGSRPDTSLGSVDVFSMLTSRQHERNFSWADFPAGPGTVLDIFFQVPDVGAPDYEFRVHTTGAVPVYIRHILVTRWTGNGRPLPVPAADWETAERS